MLDNDSPLAFARQRELTQASAIFRLTGGPAKLPAGYATNSLPRYEKILNKKLWQNK